MPSELRFDKAGAAMPGTRPMRSRPSSNCSMTCSARWAPTTPHTLTATTNSPPGVRNLLRRDLARAAELLASIPTHTPAPRTFHADDPEPHRDDVFQVRHGTDT
jgi:hypothetical protein